MASEGRRRGSRDGLWYWVEGGLIGQPRKWPKRAGTWNELRHLGRWAAREKRGKGLGHSDRLTPKMI
jgi:hypothetical protein